jgi:hypothetical protein
LRELSELKQARVANYQQMVPLVESGHREVFSIVA